MAVKLPGWHRCAHAHGDGHTIELQCQVVCPLYFKSFPVQNIEGCNNLRWSYKIQDELQQWALISESGMKFYFSRDYRNVATHFSNIAWCDQSSTNYGVIDLQHVLQSLVNCFLTAKAIQVTRNIVPCYIRLSIRDVLPQQNCEAKWKKSCLTYSRA